MKLFRLVLISLFALPSAHTLLGAASSGGAAAIAARSGHDPFENHALASAFIETLFPEVSRGLKPSDPASALILYKRIMSLRRLNTSFRNTITPRAIITLIYHHGFVVSLPPFIHAIQTNAAQPPTLRDFRQRQNITEAVATIIKLRTNADRAHGNHLMCLTETDRYSRTPLHDAAQSCNTDIVTLILDYLGVGAVEALNHPDRHGNTTLYYAALSSVANTAARMLSLLGDQAFEALNRSNRYGNTPRSMATG